MTITPQSQLTLSFCGVFLLLLADVKIGCDMVFYLLVGR